MKIYTRTGDKGETSLFTGQRVPKNDAFVMAVGDVDECNCSIGAAIAFITDEPKWHSIKEQLYRIQHALFDVGAAIATPLTRAATNKIDKTRFDLDSTRLLEHWIDSMEVELPKLHTFILPSGHPAGALLHLARSICRRAERTVTPLYLQGDVSSHVVVYLNRLSDYLFVLSRYVNLLTNTEEVKWQPHKPIEATVD